MTLLKKLQPFRERRYDEKVIQFEEKAMVRKVLSKLAKG